MPEPDRDRGSGRVDALVRALLAGGWSVTFLADEENPDQRHAHRLRQLGVATFAGYAHAPEVIAQGRFDLAVLAFWQQSARLLPVLQEQSPETRIIIDSIDVHFLREARRELGVEGRLDARFGSALVDELNTYQAADAVLAVSAKEAALLGDFLSGDRVRHLPLGDSTPRSTIPFEQRCGMLFVGNFRHLPNGEAVEYLCRDVLPRVDPGLLAEHPLTIVGNRLDDKIRDHADGLPEVRMVGWVPSVLPYVQRARLSVVPLLHGAGVKGKVIQSMMAGTPVVTTSIGAEGLDLVDAEHALIADDPSGLAGALSRLLVDATTWNHVADAGDAHARARHDEASVDVRFREIVEAVLAAPKRATAGAFRHSRARMEAYRATTAAVCRIVPTVTEPGAVVLVVSRGDDDLLRLAGRIARHFPQAADGGWAGHHPVDGPSAVRDLETSRENGARYLVVPSSSFWWLDYYTELTGYLDQVCRRTHADDHVVVYDLRPSGGDQAIAVSRVAADDRPRVAVVGTYALDRPGPPPEVVAELDGSRRFAVTQHWSQATAEPDLVHRPQVEAFDWVVSLDDNALLPSGFLDAFLPLVARLGADRAQPAHTNGPTFGLPVSERLRGCVGREMSTWTPLPVRVVRGGAHTDGPVVLVDEVAIGLVHPIAGATDAEVLDVFVAGDGPPTRAVTRSRTQSRPRLSVLIATYNRADLLAGCLEGFSRQSVDAGAFEVVVVDDGSDAATGETIAAFAGRLPLVTVRLEHAGRSAAKNLATMLARGDIVLFFDDDDRPAPDLVAEHLRAHGDAADEALGVLGFTEWAPDLAVTPLMHYLTDVDRVLFSYGNLTEGQQLDWRGFWEGRVSCRRSLLMAYGFHDQRLEYSIDIELAWRLSAHGLKVVYHPAARSWMARPIDLDQFCARIEAKGRSQALIAALHPEPELHAYAKLDHAAERWDAVRPRLDGMVGRVRGLEDRVATRADPDDLQQLHRAYREVFDAFYLKGVSAAVAPEAAAATGGRRTRRSRPALTVTMPVWSRTPDLADMAQRTVQRIRDVARLDTEVIVVDNGSPHERSLPAEVLRYDTNRGVAVAWNAGIGRANAPVVAVVNSDCLVEPGWDEALYEAATDGRRIAFPYTDHADGLGFRCPDQAGTAGWCFMLTGDVYREIGPFDEQFSPAYCEDTDYWHRAWQLGVELSPVPAARVSHARRTTGRLDAHADWLLQAHRYKYGWKHGVDPRRAPPYYNRPIVEYTGRRK
jgi:glycosyltransferase involved in cell wall biosynthesis